MCSNRCSGVLRCILTIIAVLFLHSAQVQAQGSGSIEWIRTSFYAAVADEAAAESLNQWFASSRTVQPAVSAPLLLAYEGASETLLGKHAFNPYKKYRYLINGLDKLAAAIQRAPNELEIRFLRFSILHHLPGIMGFGREREDDCKSIYNLLMERRYGTVPPDLLHGIYNFLLESGRLSAAKANNLKNSLASIP